MRMKANEGAQGGREEVLKGARTHARTRLRSDVAVADDAERLGADLAAALGDLQAAEGFDTSGCGDGG
eukprot:3112792-Pleurochrysis_carterae.AAC.1